jgi:hypothetical protein
MSDYYFEGGDDKKSWMCMAHFVISFITFVLVCIIFHYTVTMSPFSNDTSSTKSMHDVSVSLPVQDERTLRQKLAEAQNEAKANLAPKSTLTGTRDIPVFYQDYDIEAKTKAGAVYQEREGFTGALSQDDLEKMLRN